MLSCSSDVFGSFSVRVLVFLFGIPLRVNLLDFPFPFFFFFLFTGSFRMELYGDGSLAIETLFGALWSTFSSLYLFTFDH
jgi:hypothetical protein